MSKIKFIVDSPSDIPDNALQKYDITMIGLPIAVDGREYVERQTLSIPDFYALLESAKKLPTTSRAPIISFVDAYTSAWENGYTHVIAVTMSAIGSGTYESAHLAIDLFFAEHPEASGCMEIHLLDSMAFSLGYGYPVMQAAAMALEGQTVEEILDYLEDFFRRAEVYLTCFTLDYAKRSGRITAAAAFAGEVLGMRPVISMTGGTSKIVAKVRGDKNAVHKLAQICRERCVAPENAIITASASADSDGLELKALLEKEFGRKIPHYKVGAAITVNAGPRIAALCFLGPKRERHRDRSSIRLPVFVRQPEL